MTSVQHSVRIYWCLQAETQVCKGRICLEYVTLRVAGGYSNIGKLLFGVLLVHSDFGMLPITANARLIRRLTGIASEGIQISQGIQY